MARPAVSSRITPQYRFHKRSGKAIVTVYDAAGKRRSVVLPGKYESKESRAEYKRLLRVLEANDNTLPEEPEAKPDLLVSELVVKFMEERVLNYYLDPVTKEPTGEQENFRCAMRPLTRLYADVPVSEFGPRDLVAVQQAMIDGRWLSDEEKEECTKAGRRIGLARGTINGRIGRIKMMFRWATKQQLISGAVFSALLAVDGLKEGRSAARETEAVTPVAIDLVEKTLPLLPPIVRDVVQLLLHTGARVGEITGMRATEIDMTGDVWLYSPTRHKTAWRGPKYKRTIALGPKAQAIVRRYLKPKTDAFLFSPAEQEQMIADAKRAVRKTKVQPSQMNRRKENPKKKPGERFDHDDINNAIKRACKRAGLPMWHTHQLRHTAAREISRKHGLDKARAVLGHKTLQMTADYSGHDQEVAEQVMGKIG